MVVAGNRVFRESAVPEVCYPRRTLLGSLVNRGNGAALSGDCPGIYERRGKDSNLRGLTPTPQLGHLRKLSRTGAEHFLESEHGLPYGFAAPGSSSAPETFLPALTASLAYGRSTTIQLSSPC